MPDIPISGASGYVQFGKETTYGTQATTINSSFGHDVELNIESKNSIIESEDTNNRDTVKMVEGKFEGRATVTGSLANTHWIATALGSSITTGTSPYTHAFNAVNTLPSITIEKGLNLGTTDSVRLMLGCKLDNMTISGAIGEPIKFKAVYFYKTETGSTTIDATPATDAEEVFTMANASVAIPYGTTIAEVQRFEFNYDNNLIESRGAGSRFLTNIIPGKRKYSVNMDSAYENSAILAAFMGSTTGPLAVVAEKTIDLNITNGNTGTAERHLEIYFTGAKPDVFTDPLKPNTQVDQSVTIKARTGTAVAQDNSATTIFD
jgi:hypothetical protein